MKIRFHNNTSYKTLTPNDLLSDVAHLIKHINKDKIESIEMTDSYVRVYGIDCILAEIDTTKPVECSGEIRWFDKSSGEGVIRLNTGISAHFFACNVNGADSYYPQLVSNVSFEEGDKVSCQMSNDPYTFTSLGLTSIIKVA
jgi:cold shock CspA family protein